MTNPAAYNTQYSSCNICAGDLDGDGTPCTPSDLPLFVNLLLTTQAP
jgi:hypothetical protein